MGGTVLGGRKAAETIKRIYGEDHYKKLGHIGGSKSRGGGFHKDILCFCNWVDEPHMLRQCAGSKGGKISKRGPAKKLIVTTEPKHHLFNFLRRK